MAIQQKVVTVKGTEYILTHLPAGKGLVVMKHLTKLVGPAFAKMTSGDIGEVVDAILDNIDKTDVEELARRLITGASKGSMAVNFDSEFAGEYDRLYLLIKEIIDWNFGSVFQLLGSNDKE